MVNLEFTLAEEIDKVRYKSFFVNLHDRSMRWPESQEGRTECLGTHKMIGK
jgi:hypothetical protein